MIDREQLIDELFAKAVDLTPGEREKFFAKAKVATVSSRTTACSTRLGRSCGTFNLLKIMASCIGLWSPLNRWMDAARH